MPNNKPKSSDRSIVAEGADQKAQEAIRALLSGAAPDPSISGLGKWAEQYNALVDSYNRGGTTAVRQVFDVLAVNDGGLAALVAADQPQARLEIMTAAELLSREYPPVRWAVPSILPEGVTLLAGPPKMGKSWLMLDLALAIAGGRKALDRLEVEQGRVLYLALEDNERRLHRRVSQLMCEGDALIESLYFALHAPRLEEGGLEGIEKWLAQQRGTARLVIIDTLAKIRSSPSGRHLYTEDYESIAGIKQMADQHNIAIVLVHHLRKQGADDPMERISGSTGLTGAADGWLLLDRDRGAHDAVLHVTGRDIEEDSELALQWNQATATWRLMGDAKDFRTTEIRGSILRSMKELGGDGISPKDVCRAVEAF